VKRALLKDSLKQIVKTNKRFISILLMAFMGVGFFAGVRATSPDMKQTLDKYLDNKNMYDINLVSTLGLTEDDINEISQIDGTEKVVGIYSEDVFVKFEDEETVVKCISYEDEINNLQILEGNLPQNIDECVVEYNMNIGKGVKIGDYIEIRENLEDDEEPSFINTKLKVVGIVRSPIYMSRDRGTTTLGSGKVSYFIYGNKNNINSDIYTEIDIAVSGSKEINTLTEDYEKLVETVEDKLNEIKPKREKFRSDEIILEANTKLEDSQKEFDEEKANAEKKIADAEKEIADGKKEIKKNEQKIKDAEKELQDGRNTAITEFANAEAQISASETKLAEARTAATDGKAYLEAKKNEAQQGIAQINAGIETINTTQSDLEQNKALAESVLLNINKIDSTLNQLNEMLKQDEEALKNATTDEEKANLIQMIEYIKSQIESLNAQKQELLSYGIDQEKLNKINTGILECQTKKAELEKQIQLINSEIAKGENEIAVAQNQIASGYEQLESSKAELAKKRNETNQKFIDAEKEIADGKKKIEEGKKELADGEKELIEKKEEFNTKIADAERKLIDAREKVNDIENAKWYIWNRYDNAGFNSYSQDCDNIEKLGNVFPIVFFIIATLISLTTMTRMVEEERVQIGTLKALGYNKFQIMSKYIIYSLVASIIGGFLGAIFGLKFFPYVIITMYQMMYDITDIVIEINKYYMFLGIGLITACIVGATIYTANKELQSTPAEMMRPKSPKPGKRVLLEKIPFIWSKLSFTQKVTVRNMFRYKKKFLMTVVGICGCTALIVAGFGLKDSISGIMDFQYVDIYDYDMMIGLKSTLTNEEKETLIKDLENKDKIEKCIVTYMFAENVKHDNYKQESQIMVIKDTQTIDEIIKLKSLKTEEKLELNENEVIITDKLSQLLNVKVGDEIKIENQDEEEVSVKISGITEHYISHYVYMTDNLYKKLYGEDVKTNVLFTKYVEFLDEESEKALSKELLLNSKIASITLTSYLITTMDETLSAMNFVVYVLIISAGLLAFIVLYNLSNINISERIRELATIKVLGFYDKEVYDYVTREIVLLTIIGIIFGLVFGYILNSFILGTCEIGILRFKKTVLPQSYIIASVITIIFTTIINFITYFTLKKVDMIESLKSVE
jgi:putative ABC transport system permease protein